MALGGNGDTVGVEQEKPGSKDLVLRVFPACVSLLKSSHCGLQISDLSCGLPLFGRVPGFGLKIQRRSSRTT